MGAYSAAGAFGYEKFAVFRRGRSQSYAKYFESFLLYMMFVNCFTLKLAKPYSEPTWQASNLFTIRRSQFRFLISTSRRVAQTTSWRWRGCSGRGNSSGGASTRRRSTKPHAPTEVTGLWPQRALCSERWTIASVVSHKRLELFSLCFSHSGAGAAGLDPLQRLFAPA